LRTPDTDRAAGYLLDSMIDCAQGEEFELRTSVEPATLERLIAGGPASVSLKRRLPR
jgi:hypothetical protein